MHDAFCFHFCPFVSLFNFVSINSLSISHLFSLTCKYRNNEHDHDSANSLGLDFEKVVYAGEFSNNEDMEDDDLSPNLLRLMAQDEKQILPHQKVTEAINLGTEEEKREVKIGTTLSPTIREMLIDMLREYSDVFAWSYQDMPGLNTNIVVHHLPLREECTPVKQNLKRVKPKILLKIKEEVKKQLDAGFLEVSKYP